MISNHKKIRENVDEFINYISGRNVHHFYLETIAAYTDLPIDSFVEYVFQLVQWGEIDLKYEIICPEYNCNEKYVYNLFDDIPFDEYIEDSRGHEILIEKEMVIPYFQIPSALKKNGNNFEKKSVMAFPKITTV